MDGAVNLDGSIVGTYIHGLFENVSVRRCLLSGLRRQKGIGSDTQTFTLSKDSEYDKLADHVRSSIDMDMVYKIAGIRRKVR